MKTIQILFLSVLFVLAGLNLSAGVKKDTTVIFKAAIHCPSCKAKVDKNLPFEKGVKAYDFNLKDTTITVTYRVDKNSVPALRAAIERHDVKVLGMCDKNGKLIRGGETEGAKPGAAWCGGDKCLDTCTAPCSKGEAECVCKDSCCEEPARHDSHDGHYARH